MSVVDDVKARLDIVDVLSGYVNLQKAGRNYKALCPFHQEKTPSFIVFPDTQTWRCFGACGEGGDVFGFVMKSEGWNFGEALRELAKRAGVELAPYTPQQEHEQTENERLRGLLQEAARFFHDQLRESPAGHIARDYVLRRGIHERTAEQFMIGYAPDDWRQALQHLQMLGFTQDEIVEAGVAARNEQGHVYDRFRHRLMIPIRDGRGSTVGFGARALEKDAVPKYLNSPQGPLFDKSRLLFGLDMARRAVRETETVIVVEGYMDAIQAHQAGFVNVVAQMGTALTEEQLRQLDRYASRLILALDPDAAGISATMRGLNVARQTLDEERMTTFDPVGMMRYTGMLNMDIRVISLPEGQDPDDLIRENPAAWENLITRAAPVVDYLIEQSAKHLNAQSSYHEREQVARDALPYLIATKDFAQFNANVQKLARRIGIDDKNLITWVEGLYSKQTRFRPNIRKQREIAGKLDFRSKLSTHSPGQSTLREGFFLRLLIDQPERLYAANRKLRELRGDDETLTRLLAPLVADDFSRADYQAIFQIVERSLRQDELDSVEFLYHQLSPELAAVLQELQVTQLERFQQVLPRSLIAEFQSIMREQARTNTRPEPDTHLFVEEALALRQRRLERESHELYFLQQDINDITGQHHRDLMKAIDRARQLIALALREMRSFSRDT